jgi:hypothetical protein
MQHHILRFSRNFIIYNVFVCLVMSAAAVGEVVFCILYASQEIHVVLLLKLLALPPRALSIRVRIRVDVKMMLPH